MGKKLYKIKIMPTDNFKTNTPGTAGGPGSRDRTLAVKSKKNAKKSVFFCKK